MMKKNLILFTAIFSLFAVITISYANPSLAPKKKIDYLRFDGKEPASGVTANFEFKKDNEKRKQQEYQLFTLPNALSVNFTYNLG